MPGVPRGNQISVTCCKQSWTLRYATASEWISAVLTDDMSAVFPGMIRARDADRMFELWFEMPDMHRRCINVARVALSRASGREWIWSYNLIRECIASWTHINGGLLRQGVDSSKLDLSDWLDAAYSFFDEHLSTQDKAGFQARLKMMPKGMTGVRPAMSSRQELLAFAMD